VTPFGLQLKFYRQERGVSQQTLASRLSIPVRLMSKLETGRRPVTSTMLDAIGAALRLSGEEAQTLRLARECSSYRLRIPPTASPKEILLAHRLVSSMGQLDVAQLEKISALLGEPAMT
jgi:transcriptional regulator with XRE-family HTH domain